MRTRSLIRRPCLALALLALGLGCTAGPEKERALSATSRTTPVPERPQVRAKEAPPARAFVGTVEGSDAVVALIADDEQVTAYVCGGPRSLSTHTAWFLGPLASGRFELSTGERGEEMLRGEIVAGQARGALRLSDGGEHAWSAREVNLDSPAGLYMGTGQADVTGVVVMDTGHLQGVTYDIRARTLRAASVELAASAGPPRVQLTDRPEPSPLSRLKAPLRPTEGASQILRTVADIEGIPTSTADESSSELTQSSTAQEELPEMAPLLAPLEPDHVEAVSSREKLVAPLISPSPDAVYEHPLEVRLSSPAELARGCVIRYTIDGSDPTDESPSFEPRSGLTLVLDRSATVKAQAFPPAEAGSSLLPSDMEVAAFTVVDSRVPAPRWEPAGGTYNEPVQVRIVPPELDPEVWDQVIVWYCMNEDGDPVPACEGTCLYRGEALMLAADGEPTTMHLKARVQARWRETGETCVGALASATYAIEPRSE
ncbi:MAG: chitobiase/beta-hexosaminidase C-terminal domain-containing protein [Planctomycetota bacterium]